MRITDTVGRLALAALLLGAFALPADAAAQEMPTDPRWHAWLGCWEPVDPGALPAAERPEAPLACVLPAPAGSGVEIANVVEGRIVESVAVEATGEPRALSLDGCSGRESAEWSADGLRLFRSSQVTCPDGHSRRESGLSTLLPTGEWLDVQGAGSGETLGVRTVLYREVRDRDRWPAGAASAQEVGTRSVAAARIAAAAAIGTAEVLEATRHGVEPAVVEAWLLERGQGFAVELDAERLVELADTGMPESLIDLMVALSYPSRFAIDRGTGAAEPRAADGYGPGRRPGRVYPGGPFGYGGSGWYPGYYGRYPGRTVIVTRSPREDSGSGGRAVKGRGYTRGGSSGGSDGASTSGSGGASTSRGAEPSSSGSSSPGGATRTAKPRGGG